MKQKKLDKLIKLIDPEPANCMDAGCGYDVVAERTGTLYDLIKETTRIDAPRNSLDDYKQHRIWCPWATWAIREMTRRNQ